MIDPRKVQRNLYKCFHASVLVSDENEAKNFVKISLIGKVLGCLCKNECFQRLLCCRKHFMHDAKTHFQCSFHVSQCTQKQHQNSLSWNTGPPGSAEHVCSLSRYGGSFSDCFGWLQIPRFESGMSRARETAKENQIRFGSLRQEHLFLFLWISYQPEPPRCVSWTVTRCLRCLTSVLGPSPPHMTHFCSTRTTSVLWVCRKSRKRTGFVILDGAVMQWLVTLQQIGHLITPKSPMSVHCVVKLNNVCGPNW